MSEVVSPDFKKKNMLMAIVAGGLAGLGLGVALAISFLAVDAQTIIGTGLGLVASATLAGYSSWSLSHSVRNNGRPVTTIFSALASISLGISALSPHIEISGGDEIASSSSLRPAVS